MKNLLKLSILLIALTFTFNSCKNASITKRHYNKGYYLSHSHKHGKIKSKTNVESAEKLEVVANKSKLSENNTEERELIASNFPARVEPINELKSNSSVEKSSEAKKIKSTAFPYSEKFSSLKNKIHVKPIPAGMLESAREGDGLSLIWVLIVLLVVLYLLGILFDGFGLGGLIHILGVVILVLLILWLLRLI